MCYPSKGLQLQPVLQSQVSDQRRIEYAMAIELDAVHSNGDGEVEASAFLKHACHIAKTGLVTERLDRIAVAAQPKMLQRVQARQGIAISAQSRVEVHQVGLLEGNARYR